MKSSKNITPPVKTWNRGVVIDTGPLLIALVFHINAGYAIRSPKIDRIITIATGNDSQLRDSGFQTDFLRWLKSQISLKTVAHVLVEIANHMRNFDLGEADRATFWEATIEFWKEFKLEEQTLRLQEKWRDPFFREMIEKIGPTDTAIIALGIETHLPILTVDESLAKSARAIESQAFTMKDLFSSINY